MSVIKAVSATFNTLAEKFLSMKAQEKQAVETRREVGDSILSLPEVEAHKRDKGSITLRSDEYEIGVTFTQSESRDLEAIAKALPHDALARIFPPKPTFSQSGLNAYLKELDAQALLDPKARKLAAKIRETLEACTTSKPGAAQIAVTRVESN
jgi:hypothetical protein